MKDYAKELRKAAIEAQGKINRKKIRAQMPEEYWVQFSKCWDCAFLFGRDSTEFRLENEKLKDIAKKVSNEAMRPRCSAEGCVEHGKEESPTEQV